MRGTVILILILLLAILSATTVYIAIQNDLSARTQAEQALESTALAISSAAESALRKGTSGSNNEMRETFSDRVVAYGLIADKTGKILFHTNPRLSGAMLREDSLSVWLQSGKPFGKRIVLQTGTPAYEYNYIIHRPDGEAELLRLVIHTTAVDHILSQARRMWWTVGILLGFLWTAGIFSGFMLLHSFKLREELDRKKQMVLIGQMTAVLAHEIRNALGSMKGYTQWVYEKMPDEDSKKVRLEMALRGSERIESLVNELLLFSREEHYNIELFDADIFIQDTVAYSRYLWKGEIDVRTEPGIWLKADRVKLQGVIINGIQNAVQAMDGEGSIWLSVFSRGRMVWIQIKDTGHGIPESEVPRLFTPFYTTKTNGVGLGLSYSKKVVEGMGGDIELSNRKDGKGAVLTIRLKSEGE